MDLIWLRDKLRAAEEEMDEAIVYDDKLSDVLLGHEVINVITYMKS